ncbi:MAG TPA: HAMP domain-containing sensor histidine kinase [Jiangellaceae bacterium]|nr:HAMP domain-containing sensor histidine kinase [Jiangellaceae bacterium]
MAIGAGISVRARVMAAVLVVAALGMLLAGLTSHLIQQQRVDSRIDAALAQEVAEFRALAATGLDPRTGEPFATVESLFFLALERNIPDRNEGMLAMIDGNVELVPSPDVAAVRLETDESLLELLRDVPPDARVRVATADTELGRMHYVAVPVRVEGDPAAGLYVVAYARDLEQADVVASARTYAMVSVVALVVVGAVGWLVAGRLLQPIRLLRETAQRISDTDQSGRIPVTGNDDVSELTRTVNAMLDRLEAAFALQREFLDDAGHELRTPITIVRGHLELMEPGDGHDVAETRALALDELDRMQRLVDDLVVLAKAQRPDFVRPAPVELDRLTDEVIDKARPLGERDWRVDARAPVTVELDAQRITQAWLELITNAVKFTEPGQTVAVGSRVGSGAVQLWVRDTGPGMAAADADRIFERFRRAAAGQRAEGSGLGLAIVKAIAEAHGGQVSVTTAPGRGSTFVMELPVVGRSLDDTVSLTVGEQ